MQNKLRRGVFLKKSRKMKKMKVFAPARPDIQPEPIELRISNDDIAKVTSSDPMYAMRLAQCWNILRTLSDNELESLEKQTDLVIKEHGEEFVAVHIGPSLAF